MFEIQKPPQFSLCDQAHQRRSRDKHCWLRYMNAWCAPINTDLQLHLLVGSRTYTAKKKKEPRAIYLDNKTMNPYPIQVTTSSLPPLPLPPLPPDVERQSCGVTGSCDWQGRSGTHTDKMVQVH